MSIENFWGDWQHNSADSRPASYTANKILTYHCGKCGLQIKRDGWPQYCAQGHKNERPE